MALVLAQIGALLALLILAAASSVAGAAAQGGGGRKMLVAEEEKAAVDKRRPLTDDCEVSEVHIALADDQTTIRVAWRTYGRDCGSVVYYGALDGAKLGSAAQVEQRMSNRTLLKSVLGTTYSLTEGIMCTAPARKKPFIVTMHVAHLTDLEPDTAYWYSFQGSSRKFSFQSPVEIGVGRSRKFSFLAYGDMGESAIKGRKCPMAGRTLSTIMSEVEREDPSRVDLVVHVGDLAYADGSHKVWDSFMTEIEPLASRMPYMVGVGNHEYDFIGPADNDPSGVTEPYHPLWGNFGSESGGECGAMTAKRFLMPSVRTATDNPPFWYSFDYGLVHFTMISTEHDISPGSMQYRWLARDLANVDRCVTPWLVVGMHRPMYVVYPHKDNRVVGDHLRDFVEDLLLEYQVDITLAGHVHTYYRTCDVRQERCTEDGSGVQHFVIGTAGHKLSDITDEQRDWLDGDVNDFGFVRFDVNDDTMHASFILSSTGEVADSTKLVTRIYTDEECVDLRATRPDKLKALEQRLETLTAQHAQRTAQEALLAARQQQEQQREQGTRAQDDDHDHDDDHDDDHEEEEEDDEETAAQKMREQEEAEEEWEQKRLEQATAAARRRRQQL